MTTTATIPSTPAARIVNGLLGATPVPRRAANLPFMMQQPLNPMRTTMTGIKVFAQAENAVTITSKEREEFLTETARKEAQLPLLTIVRSVISLYSWEDMQNIADIVQITNGQYHGPGSVNDPRMGVVSLNVACQYCGQIDCPGHHGLIRFGRNVMIYNPATIRELVQTLICVCGDCGGLLITQDIVQRQGFMNISYDRRLTEMSDYCKDHECIRHKPQIGGGALIPCTKNPSYITTDVAEKGEVTYKVPAKGNRKVNSDDPIHVITIQEVERILNTISIRDAWLLGFPSFHRQFSYSEILKRLDRVNPEILIRYHLQRGNQNHRQLPHDEVMNILDNIKGEELKKVLKFPTGSHPRNMIMHGILVPPIIARPPVIESGITRHDQITTMYITIFDKAKSVEGRNSIGSKAPPIELYLAVKQLLFKTDGKKMGTREVLSIVERIQGKNALLRGLLMGKRNNYCGRTVAGPDPSLRLGQVRIPEVWASVLTKKQTVNNTNITALTQLMLNGKVTHIISKATGMRRYYSAAVKYNLRIGDRVERWLQNGDRVISNRQPTLHKGSMMSYEVVLGREYTIGSHLSTTTPMNLDYDGDENNIWCPQDFEVEAEVEILANVKYNIMSLEQNRPIMAFVMNSITAAYLASYSETRLHDDLFTELLSFITNKEDLVTLDERLQKYGIHPRSGQAILSALFPSNFYYRKGEVLILEGILISGRLQKSHVGTSNRSIIQEIHKKYGPQRTADLLTDGPWILNKWIIERGFSVGLLDMINFVVDPVTGEEYDRNVLELRESLAKIYVQLEAVGAKVNDPVEEIYRQKQIFNIVNITQGVGLHLAKEVLSGNNAIGVMTDQGSASKGAGTKGGVANIAQMMGSVGQQFYRGERLRPTLTGGRRLLPSYDVDDNGPEGHGFIPQSFFTGLTPQGLFFLQAGGREGILDTALGTAKTGAMQHRMMKAFENTVIGHDGSIRNTIGTMFSPMYNSGYDSSEMISVETPGKSDYTSFFDPKATAAEFNLRRGWVTKENNAKIVAGRAKLADAGVPINTKYDTAPAIANTTINYDITVPVPIAQPIIKVSKYEKARIIGTRAMQLSNNAPTRTDIGTTIDPVLIAMKEYKEGQLHDFFAIRKFPDGSYKLVHPTLETI